jgi:hypothetical protein
VIGEKNKCAPLGNQSTHFSSSKVGIPCIVLARVCSTLLGSVRSSGRKNLAPGMERKAFLVSPRRTLRIGSGPCHCLASVFGSLF